MKLSIITPCYNEEEGIENLSVRLEPVLNELSKKYEIELVFVDDGSRDRTNELLHKFFGKQKNVKIIKHEKNQNLGGAMRTGFAHSTGEIIVSIDSDCTYDPADIPALVAALDEKTDMVNASAYHPKGR